MIETLGIDIYCNFVILISEVKTITITETDIPLAGFPLQLLAIIAIAYLLMGYTLGKLEIQNNPLFQKRRLDWRLISDTFILKEFMLKWVIIYSLKGVEKYFSKIVKKRAIEISFKPLKIFFCISSSPGESSEA